MPLRHNTSIIHDMTWHDMACSASACHPVSRAGRRGGALDSLLFLPLAARLIAFFTGSFTTKTHTCCASSGCHSGIVSAMRGSLSTHGRCRSMLATSFLPKHCKHTCCWPCHTQSWHQALCDLGGMNKQQHEAGCVLSDLSDCCKLELHWADDAKQNYMQFLAPAADTRCTTVRRAHLELPFVSFGHCGKVEPLRVVGAEACVHELAQEGIVKQCKRELLVILQLVVSVYADGLKVAPKGAQQHDHPGDH